ncbi:MAG TPA: TIM-barrel domain-containing protein, partial [Chitinophagaceae bacterium]
MRPYQLLISSLTFLLLFLLAGAKGVPSSFEKTPNGIIVYTDPLYTGTAQAVRLEVVTDRIIRVTAAPGKSFSATPSLITVYKRDPKVTWQVVPGKESVTLKTGALSAVAHLKTGAVTFYDAAGNKILGEPLARGRRIEPAVFEGRRLYSLEQTFETSADDAFYGLGQHQDDVFNYKGEQVTLFQNNTEVAVPFLVSAKNYGVLWDNYSITKVGDTRPFQSLSALRLFSKEGLEGWLTATYSNDKKAPEQVTVQRAEAAINYEFVNDSKLFLPTEFKPENGVVVWEGSIASGFSGVHKLRFTYGGYIRAWVNGQLVLDRWRRAWNPAPALLDVVLTKDVKTPVKIEWIPEGGESYLSLKWQEPAEEKNRVSFSSEAGEQIDYYFVSGKSMDEVIAGYRTLTGKAPIVPKWALGFWQSRERYKTQEEILSTVAEFRRRGIPLDNIVLDWFYWKEDQWGSQEFDPARFPNPDSMIQVLHDQHHAKLMISVWPKFYEGINNYEEFAKRGWLYKRNIADRQKDWVGPGYTSTFYDAFNEDARKAFWDLIHKKIYTRGVDAWWMDASEPDILSNVSPERRKQQMGATALGPAAQYLNAYPLQNAKGIYEGQRSADPNKRVFLLTRSGFAGSQRYAAAIWSGDIGARWHDLKAQIPAGINFSLSGLPYWTMDIGGFVVENRFERPKETDLEEWRELMTRWYQFGAFVPLFRVHGQFPFREIYNIAPEGHPAYTSMLYYNKLRYRLLPYIYSLAGQAYHSDYTLMRGLPMDFGNDTAVRRIGDQFLLGPSLMVSPVYNYGQRTREVYLPKGQGWYDLYTGKRFEGGQKVKADAPYERMPLFVKEGSIIPFGPDLQYTDEKPSDTLTLRVYTGRNASFSLYEDGGTTYDYEKGAYSVIPFTYNESTKSLTIGERKGSFPQMIARRTIRVVWI